MSGAGGRTLVLIAPHPDDETLGCGGYLAQRAEAGDRIVIVVLTRGEKLFSLGLGIHAQPSPDEVAALRREESLRAVACLGLSANDLHFWDFPDQGLVDQADTVVARLVPLLQAARPVEILCTSECEGHPDHVAAARITRRACRDAGLAARIRWYITSLREGLTPADLPFAVERIDIRAQLDRKTRAVAQFRAHLDCISPLQKQPICADFAAYLSGEETLSVPQPV